MEERSRIRFNPVTKEIEIEGSEVFVRTYFSKIQKLLSEPAGEKTEEPKPAKKRPAKKTKKTKGKSGQKKAPKETHMDTVVGLIRSSDAGITTAGLKEKTGLAERQIWSIVYRAEKQGKIRKTKRGIYVAV